MFEILQEVEQMATEAVDGCGNLYVGVAGICGDVVYIGFRK